jgi:hypothetical protein
MVHTEKLIMTQEQGELYLAYWDSLGFECVINLSAHEKRSMWTVLKGQEPSKLPLHPMLMRAKANPQRKPEIWTFWSCVDQETLLQYAEDEPQALADTIRRLGKAVFVTPRQKELIK